MKEFHVVEFIGKPKDVMGRMEELFNDQGEIRVTIRFEISSCTPVRDSKAVKNMLDIKKTIKVNKRLKKHDSAIVESIVTRFGIDRSVAENLVRNYPDNS